MPWIVGYLLCGLLFFWWSKDTIVETINEGLDDPSTRTLIGTVLFLSCVAFWILFLLFAIAMVINGRRPPDE